VIHHSIDGRFAIREGQWKLEFCPGSGGWGKPTDASAKKDQSPIQLYDMAADPGETHNVQGEHPDIVSRLTELIERSIAEGRSTPGKSQENDRKIDYLHGAVKLKK
jgi:arylsulfatase A